MEVKIYAEKPDNTNVGKLFEIMTVANPEERLKEYLYSNDS